MGASRFERTCITRSERSGASHSHSDDAPGAAAAVVIGRQHDGPPRVYRLRGGGRPNRIVSRLSQTARTCDDPNARRDAGGSLGEEKVMRGLRSKKKWTAAAIGVAM